MPLLALALLVVIPLATIVLMPVVLVQRYRHGHARRLARPWIATLNMLGTSLSVAFFLVSASVATIWVPGAITYALGGLAFGCALGLIGVRVSRWEAGARSLYYTPNRWLVLVITFAVAARLVYGLWRGWMSWAHTASTESFLSALGVRGSLAAAAIVLGYYFAYSLGVQLRVRKWRARALRGMP